MCVCKLLLLLFFFVVVVIQKSPFGKVGNNGLHCIVFNHDGTVYDYSMLKIADPADDFVKFIDGIQIHCFYTYL